MEDQDQEEGDETKCTRVVDSLWLLVPSVFLQVWSSGPAARRLATIRIADSGAWSDAGGGLLSVVQCFQPAVSNSR